MAQTLTRRGALRGARARRAGLEERRLARPFQAAWASALSFSAGAALPLLAVAAGAGRARGRRRQSSSPSSRSALLGDLGARLGGAPRGRATIRVVVWGAVAMAVTAGIGALVGTVT